MASRTDRDGTTRAFTYDDAGRPYLFTSYDAADGGAVVNQVRRSYDGLGRLVSEWQEHGGPVTAATPFVGYAYDAMPGGDHSRRTATTYPSGWVLGHSYGGGTDGGLDDRISRLSALTEVDASAPGGVRTLEALDYLGLSTVVGRRRPQPGLDLVFYNEAGTAAPGADRYSGLDRFGRVLDHRWTDTSVAGWGDDTSPDADRFAYGYDADGNRLWRDNLVAAAGGGGGGKAFDEMYAYDGLGRLTSFARGVRSGTGIDGTPSRSQAWGLDALGNWLSVADEAGVTQTRTHDARNRIVGVAGDGGGGNTTPAYTANGEMTRDLHGRVFTYDAWGRVASADADGAGGAAPAAYAHDALGRRVEAGGVHFYYNDRWQLIETRDAGGETAERFVWSPAYVDAMVLRDRDTTGDGVFDERLYVLQDANHNVTAVADASGEVQERYAYDPYGTRTVLDAGWQPRAASLFDQRHGHQGGLLDEAAGSYHFRHRDLTATGTWNRPDPLGYVDGMNVYEYVRSSAVNLLDPEGLQAWYQGWGHTFAYLAGFGPSGSFGQVWNGAFQGGSDGLLSWTNGFIPWVNIIPPSWFYDFDDTTLEISEFLGGVSRDVWVTSLIPNLTAWSKDPVRYELGSKTLPDHLWNIVKDKDPVERAKYLISTLGWMKTVIPHKGNYMATVFGARRVAGIPVPVGTGFTPGASMAVYAGTVRLPELLFNDGIVTGKTPTIE